MPNTIAQNLTRLINAKEAIGEAISNKGVTVEEEDGLENFPALISAIDNSSSNLDDIALRLTDWEGTVLKEYTAEQVASLAALPEPSSLNTNVDRDLLSFQGYNWSISDIKAWVTAHEGECLPVGAIYTTTDGQDHIYRNNPRINTDGSVSMLKKGTTSISDNAFYNCYSLTNVNIPYGVTTIGGSAFKSCNSLTNINIPDGVTSIRDSAFNSCCSLTSVNIPEGVTSIANYAFNGCRSLTSVNIPDGVTSIGSDAFNGCYSLTSVNIPDGVTSIGASAFNGCYSLTTVTIPDGITAIESSAFNSCRSLTSVNIPDSVTSIESSAFNGCRSLTNVIIPDGVTSIGKSAFSGCSCLTDIVIKGKPNLANVNAFSNIYSDYLIYVPKTKLSWYSTATNWTVFYNNNRIMAIEDNAEYLESIGIEYMRWT